MNRDPAFLFYSKDFYEGTRLMLPEERACYIDLMIYQHQNGPIPNDVARLQLYCAGCSVAVITRVLNQHFTQTANGWLNQRLHHEVKQRAMGKPRKIAAAVFAGLISGYKLTKKQKELLKKNFDINNFIQEGGVPVTNENVIKQNVRAWFNQMLNQPANQTLTINANANEIEDKNETKTKNVAKKESVVFPWQDTNFINQWQQWKTYKAQEFGFKYKSVQSEQAALATLVNKSNQHKQTAIAIIHQSMANGWKGFFEIQPNTNKTNEQVFTEAMGSEVGQNFRFK